MNKKVLALYTYQMPVQPFNTFAVMQIGWIGYGSGCAVGAEGK